MHHVHHDLDAFGLGAGDVVIIPVDGGRVDGDRLVALGMLLKDRDARVRLVGGGAKVRLALTQRRHKHCVKGRVEVAGVDGIGVHAEPAAAGVGHLGNNHNPDGTRRRDTCGRERRGRWRRVAALERFVAGALDAARSAVAVGPIFHGEWPILCRSKPGGAGEQGEAKFDMHVEDGADAMTGR